jgi:hypothetical protein
MWLNREYNTINRLSRPPSADKKAELRHTMWLNRVVYKTIKRLSLASIIKQGMHGKD